MLRINNEMAENILNNLEEDGWIVFETEQDTKNDNERILSDS
jgi:hypothetical protein